MLINAHNFTGAPARRRAGLETGLTSSHAVVAVVMMCVSLAFFPVTEPAELTSMALNASRITELGLLGLAAAIITVAVLGQRCVLSVRSQAPIIAFLFCLWAMLTSFWSVSPLLSFARAGTLTMLLYIAVAISIYARQMFTDSVRGIAVSATAGILAGVGLLLVINILIWGTPLELSHANTYTGRGARLVFAQSEPLETGEYLALGTVMALLTLQRKGMKILVVGALYGLLILSDSRNLIVFVPVSLALARLQHGSLQSRFFLMATLVFGIAALLFTAITGNLANIVPADIATLNGRVPLWMLAADVIADHPILGIGYYASRYYLMDSHFVAGHAHNAYVETMMTTGLIGLSLLLVFIGYCIRLSVDTRDMVLTTLVILTSLGSIFDPLILASNNFTFFLMVVLIVTAERVADQRISASAQRSEPRSFTAFNRRLTRT